MKALFAAVVLMIAGPALADPLPAGKCTLADDGVVHPGPLAGSPAAEGDPRILSMNLPNAVMRESGAIFDVTFVIGQDGSVSAAKVLCATPNGAGSEAELVKASADWRFAPMKRAGKAVSAKAAYRIVVGGGRIPLSFTPGVMLEKLS